MMREHYRPWQTAMVILSTTCALLPCQRGLTGQHATTSVISADKRPNIVLVMTDDQGWGDLSLNGNTNLNTPRIDRLATEGSRFDRFYVCPVCSPTRAEFLTGRYHPRGGVYSTSAGGERLDLDESTIADTFRAAGYATAAYGKWHNGMQYPYHPNGRGFDDYYGFCSGHWGDYFSPLLEHNGRLVQGSGFLIDDFTEHAMDFIESHRDRSFFVYLPFNTPHSPMQVPDRWWNSFRDKTLTMHNREPNREDVGHIRAALAMCENIDWNVGRLLDKLDELHLSDDTIVAYFCDNGPNGVRWNGGMKGRKGSTDEGGVRSPLILRWPGRIRANHLVEQIGAAIDLRPTLADLAGIPVHATKPLDGLSLKPVLVESSTADEQSADTDGESSTSQRLADRVIVSHWNKKVSVRNQRFRLDKDGHLFDLQRDPGQDRDVAAEHRDVADQLSKVAADWSRELLPGLRDDDRPFPVGHADFKYTQLPARDASIAGNIKRSNRFPNCSFFTNWTHLDDRIAWDADVLSAGRFDVDVYYSCPAADVGSMVELTCGSSRLTGHVATAHDPPLRGGEHDRVDRAESYIKDFKPMRLGTIKLVPGRQQMTLKAVEIPGQLVMDFRLLMLTRAD